MTPATVVDLYFLEVPGKFSLHNKTNKCAYLKRVYHMLIITDMLEPLSRSSLGQICTITGSLKGLLKCIYLYKAGLRLPTWSWNISLLTEIRDKIQFI